MNNQEEKKETKRITSRQIVAIIGIVLLVFLYIATLIVAIFDQSSSGSLFRTCLVATIAIPLLVWIYAWLYRKFKERS